MASLVPAILSILLAALYFSGVDATPELGLARNGALIAVGLWGVVAGLSKRSAPQPAAKDLATTTTNQPPSQAAIDHVAQKAAAAAPAPGPQPAPARDGRDVLNFLSLMQEKGRLLDFLMDDVSRYADAQVGAAARVVHQGAGAALREYFAIKPVADSAEGSSLTLGSDYDAHSYRLVGRVIGEPPYRGQVLHRGWLTTSINLPELRPSDAAAHQAKIITPAEVELS